MNDQMLNESLWSRQMMQLTTWLEWMQPFLYCLLVLVVVSLIIAMLDLAFLCGKDFYSARKQKMTKDQTAAAALREATSASVVTLKQQSYDRLKVLFLLLCFGLVTFE